MLHVQRPKKSKQGDVVKRPSIGRSSRSTNVIMLPVRACRISPCVAFRAHPLPQPAPAALCSRCCNRRQFSILVLLKPQRGRQCCALSHTTPPTPGTWAMNHNYPHPPSPAPRPPPLHPPRAVRRALPTAGWERLVGSSKP